LSEILDRVTSSPWTIGATLVVVLACLWILYRLIHAFAGGSGQLAKDLLNLLGDIFKELFGGSQVAPYERLNGIMVAGLLLVTVALLLLLMAQTVKGVFLGDAPEWPLLAAFLFCFVVFAGCGLTCVNFCRRHKDDVQAAKKHSS
jgi:uncharacterized integral membrane protein